MVAVGVGSYDPFRVGEVLVGWTGGVARLLPPPATSWQPFGQRSGGGGVVAVGGGWGGGCDGDFVVVSTGRGFAAADGTGRGDGLGLGVRCGVAAGVEFGAHGD